MGTYTSIPETGDYRYLLHYAGAGPSTGSRVTACFTNPAGNTEAAFRASSTCRAVERLSEREGWASVTYVNLFARISKSLDELWMLPYDDVMELVGPDNDEAIRGAVESADFVVVGFGSPKTWLVEKRVREVCAEMGRIQLFAVGGPNAGGWPRHPSAIPGWTSDAPLNPWKLPD